VGFSAIGSPIWTNDIPKEKSPQEGALKCVLEGIYPQVLGVFFKF